MGRKRIYPEEGRQERSKAYQREYYLRTKEKRQKYKKEYYLAHKEDYKDRSKKWMENNREKWNEYMRGRYTSKTKESDNLELIPDWDV